MTKRQYPSFQEKPRHRSSRNTSLFLPSRLASLGSVLRRNQDLLRNAGSLVGTSGVTSIFGFAYWIYAARIFSAEAVGYGSAAISTMILLGAIGMFGLDTMLMGELPRGGNRSGLMMASFMASFIASFALGLGFALISLAFGTHFVEINGTVIRMAIFSFGVAITGATSVFDAATIGLMRGGLQLSRNATVSIIKMAALPAAALILRDAFGVGITLAWVIGTVISLLPVAVMIKRGGERILHRPDWITFWRLRRVTLAHNWLNLAITIPARLIPVLVSIVVSPASNGAYYIANMIFSFLFMVPGSLSTVLFTAAAAAPEKVAEKLRFVLRMSLIIGIPGGLTIGLTGHFILSIFGASYAKLATGPLWLLILSYLPGIPNNIYITVARIEGRFNQTAIFLAVFSAFRMAALVLGGKMGGLYGLSCGMLAVQLTQSLITAPSVLRTAFGSVQARRAGDAVTDGETRLRSAGLVAEEMQIQQEVGIAALIALATRVAPPQPRLGTDALGTNWPTCPTSTPTHRPTKGQGHQARPAAVALTRGDPAIMGTNWGESAEAAFRSRQERGMAALIAIATQAARF